MSAQPPKSTSNITTDITHLIPKPKTPHNQNQDQHTPHSSLSGNFTTLTHPIQKRDIESFWHHANLPDNAEETYRYLLTTPPETQEELFQSWIDRPGRVNFAIKADVRKLGIDHPRSRFDERVSVIGVDVDGNADADADARERWETVGLVSYSVVESIQRTVDVGIILAPVMRRTVAATEVVYLVLKNVFEAPIMGEGEGEEERGREEKDGVPASSPSLLRFRRVMWRCNSLNEKSRRAAERFGFLYEGTIRRHRVVKGVWIDSDWLAIVEDEWERVKRGFEGWLKAENFDEQGRQRRTLREIREELEVLKAYS